MKERREWGGGGEWEGMGKRGACGNFYKQIKKIQKKKKKMKERENITFQICKYISKNIQAAF